MAADYLDEATHQPNRGKKRAIDPQYYCVRHLVSTCLRRNKPERQHRLRRREGPIRRRRPRFQICEARSAYLQR
jgi:hypothetical protein